MEGLTLHPEITQMAHQLHRGGFSSLQHLTTARSNQTQVGHLLSLSSMQSVLRGWQKVPPPHLAAVL